MQEKQALTECAQGSYADAELEIFQGIFTNDEDILARTELQISTTYDKTLREHCPARRNQSTLLRDTRTMSGACNQGCSANLSLFPGAAS